MAAKRKVDIPVSFRQDLPFAGYQDPTDPNADVESSLQGISHPGMIAQAEIPNRPAEPDVLDQSEFDETPPEKTNKQDIEDALLQGDLGDTQQIINGESTEPIVSDAEQAKAYDIAAAQAQAAQPQTIPQQTAQNKLEQYLEDQRKKQMEDYGNLASKISAYQNRPREIDFTPLAAFADYLNGGGNALQTAKNMQPLNAEQRAAKDIELQKMLMTAQQGMSKQAIDELKAKLLGQFKAGGQEQREMRTSLQANTQYSKQFQPLDDTILAANRVHSIIGRIRAGELKSTPTLTTDLSNALASMFNKGSAATVAGSEHAVAGLNSLEGKAASNWGWVEGKPMNTITPEQLEQLDKDVGAIGNEYVSARNDSFNSWIQGIPQGLREPLQNRFQSFGNSAGKKISDTENKLQPKSAPTKASGGQSYSKDVIQYSKSHGISPAQAQKIKDSRSGE